MSAAQTVPQDRVPTCHSLVAGLPTGTSCTCWIPALRGLSEGGGLVRGAERLVHRMTVRVARLSTPPRATDARVDLDRLVAALRRLGPVTPWTPLPASRARAAGRTRSPLRVPRLLATTSGPVLCGATVRRGLWGPTSSLRSTGSATKPGWSLKPHASRAATAEGRARGALSYDPRTTGRAPADARRREPAASPRRPPPHRGRRRDRRRPPSCPSVRCSTGAPTPASATSSRFSPIRPARLPPSGPAAGCDHDPPAGALPGTVRFRPTSLRGSPHAGPATSTASPASPAPREPGAGRRGRRAPRHRLHLPETFLPRGRRPHHITVRPIKGTRPQKRDPNADAAAAAELVGSEKDRAENVMVVDMERNDLGGSASREPSRSPSSSP